MGTGGTRKNVTVGSTVEVVLVMDIVRQNPISHPKFHMLANSIYR